MGRRSLSLVTTFFILSQYVVAQLKPYISTEAEYNTECKTCPRSLCPNQLYYSGEETLNVTCWTRGTKIMGNRLWLQSEVGCYITQYDVLEHNGDYTTDLEYCGPDSEEQDLTIEYATLEYKTECRICPGLNCDTIAYLQYDTEVELTCWSAEGQVIIDDPYWMKTTNNCYVAQKNLYSKPDITYLDPCGPIPLLESEKHYNENGTSDANKRDPTPVPAPGSLAAMYLVNVTIGEEYAPCRSCPQETCNTEKTYEFNQEVWVQCVTAQNPNGTWWSETGDRCYVNNSDFWESPEGDYYRMPLCENFGGGTPDPDQD